MNIFLGPPDIPSVYIQQEDWNYMDHEVYLLDDNTTLEITWDRPEDNGAEIDFYRNWCIDLFHLCKMKLVAWDILHNLTERNRSS